MKHLILLLAMLLGLLATPALAAEPAVVLGVDRLEGESDTDYWDRLFIQCASWTAAYGDVSQPAKEKLMELGVPPLYHLVPTWLGDGDVRHRVTLEEIIVKVGSAAAPTLLPFIADSNKHLRQRCIYVLGDFDRPDILPALRPLLATETDMLVLPTLIEAVGKRGAGVTGLASELALLTSHADERVRRASAVAMGRIGDPAAITPLTALLHDPLFSVRFPGRDAILKLQGSGRFIGGIAPDAPATVRALAFELLTVDGVRNSSDTWQTEIQSMFVSPAEEIDPLELIGGLRGALSAWKVDHAQGDQLFELLPEHFDDPRVEATHVMILAERDRLLKAEASTG